MDHLTFLRIAMSMEDAKTTLGFPPESSPSRSEIRDAYLEKAKKVHPDVGGSTEAMKELNVAKDILEGKARPTYDRRPSTYGPGPSPYTPSKPRGEEVSFEEAKSKAGIPSGVNWLFVTDRQRGTSYSSDEFDRSESTWVAYGRTDRQHVFVAANHFAYSSMYHEHSDVWKIKSVEVPIKKDEGTNPAWLYGNVVRAFKGIGFKGRFNSKVQDAQGWKFDDHIPTKGPWTSIKHWLVSSGQVSGADPSVAGRKQVIEISKDRSYTPKSDYHEEPHDQWNFRDGKYRGDYHQVTLTMNGKPYHLSESDFHKFRAARIGGRSLDTEIFGDYGERKQLTRARKGRTILGWMAANFTDLPSDAMEILQAAEAQMKG